jgi:high-affinity iron transporter
MSERAGRISSRRVTVRRAGWWALGLAAVGVLVWQGLTATGGVPNPTGPSARLSHSAVILDSGLLVFREGLETILVLAAVSASFVGANRAYRRPVAAGAGLALAATFATWFIVVAVLGAVGGAALSVQAATGLLAVVVLLLVMNWFFHRVYWTGWISNHHRRRKRLLADAEHAGVRRTMLGLALLGATSVYREGFEVVLFLQNLRLRYGSGVVLEGAAIGLAFTALVGFATFVAHHRLPYKRMLVLTGVLLGVVLVVMVGESVQEMQQAGWLPVTPLGINIPGWMGLWFAVFPNVESFAAQGLAAALVIGSYVLAEKVRVKRPRRRGQQPGIRPERPPGSTPARMRTSRRVAG